MIPLNYVPVPYPKMKYHRHDGTVVVKNEADDLALGPEWKDHPNDCIEPEPVAAPVITDEQAAKLYGMKATEVVAHIKAAPDGAIAELEATRAAEVSNPNHPGGRKSVVAALDARIAALQASL